MEPPDIDMIHEVLLEVIEEDPDIQIKALVASHLAQRNSPLITQKLMSLVKSPAPDVREIIAMSLEGHFDVLDAMLDWFETEIDEATLNKLFITLSSTLHKVAEGTAATKTALRLKKLIDEQHHLNYCLELIGYCSEDIAEKTLMEATHKYRFNDEIRASVLRGILHLAYKSQSLPDELLHYLIDLVETSYERPILRKIGLDALGKTHNAEVIDLLELIVETDHNPELRRKAVEIIGNWGVIELSSLLIEKLKYDGIATVRASAATALGAISSFEALPELAEALETDVSFFVREASAEALGNLKSQQALAALLKGLEDQDSYVRSISAWSIEQIQPTPPELIQRICSAAGSIEQGSSIRSGMVALLARMSSIPHAANCLLTIFRKDRTPLRELVIEALEEFVHILKDDQKFLDDDLPYIQEILAISPSFSLRAAICSFFGHLKEDSTFLFLLDRLINDEDAFVQRQAAWAISILDPTNHIAQIRSLLHNKTHNKITPLFLEILTSWADIEDVPLALSYLKPDLENEWRQRAVELLTAIIDSPDLVTNKEYTYEIIDTLISLLQKDNSNAVRSTCAHALGHFEGHDFLITPTLIRAIKTDRIYTVRELAAEALGYRGGISAVPELINLINYELEKDPSIRYFSSLALLNIEAQMGKKSNLIQISDK
ncbi:MAG: HEAT repeat domain-containing protein [Candidatus Heimdallarchaeota archaeon]|nr:MAG: HEAT repeat domain-containing protein [Candidatus Heimdallarchaeota archaeon]